MTILKKTAVLAAASSFALTATPASAIVYFLDIDVGAGNVSGSITTDDSLGALAQASVTDWELLLNDGVTAFTLDGPSNSAFLLQGSSLSATANALSFDFNGSGLALFQNPNIGSSVNYFCLEVSGCFSGSAIDNAYGLRTNGNIETSAQRGVVEFAFAGGGAVPEPATWAFMIFGFGAIGGALRRQRKANVKVSYA